jgi:hypothetical protein
MPKLIKKDEKIETKEENFIPDNFPTVNTTQEVLVKKERKPRSTKKDKPIVDINTFALKVCQEAKEKYGKDGIKAIANLITLIS